MAKEVKESPTQEGKTEIASCDLLENIERSLIETSEIGEEKLELVQEDHLKDELMTKDAAVTIDIDTTDKRQQRAIANQRNTYAAKKTVAQGMMDVALITANANQLRYLIEYQRKSPTFYINVFLIVLSLLLQIAVGISLIFKGRFDMRGESKSLSARRINNYVVVGVFLTTIINVFVAAFSISSPEFASIPSTAFNGRTN